MLVPLPDWNFCKPFRCMVRLACMLNIKNVINITVRVKSRITTQKSAGLRKNDDTGRGGAGLLVV